MKRKTIIAASIFLLLGFFSFSNHTEEKIKENIQHKIEKYYLQGLQNFLVSVQHLKKEETQNKKIELFLKSRILFKKIEFLVGYEEVMGDEISRDFRWINGPNLITDEYDSLSSQTVYPHGLQTIEELLFEDYESNKEELQKEIQFLEDRLTYMIQRFSKVNAMQAQEFHLFIWDALRYGLIRISSLGITGFDVPLSQEIIPETAASLETMKTVISYYQPLFKDKNEIALYKKGLDLFQKAIVFTQQQKNSNDFDRLVFMKNHAKPLSDWMQQSVDLLGFSFPVRTRAIQNQTAYLYDKDFFNLPFFITKMSKEKMELGKKLFFDQNLSGNKNRNCATCHLQEKGLADGNVKSISLKTNQHLLRNTPSLWNVAFQSKFFYDARVQRLELQILDVIKSEDEMQGDIKKILEYVKNDENYVQLFQKAYNGMMNEFTLTNALSDYLRSYISLNSRFDQYMRGESHAFLTEDEKKGFNLFMGKAKCGTCHFPPLFNGLIPPKYKNTESEIIGVPISKNKPNVLDLDLGRYGFTRLSIHKNAFKTSGIRNIEFTAPYMHNGVFETLEEVMDFYNNGGGAGQGMDLPNQTLSSDSLHLNQKEIQQIISFMKSLSDTVHVNLFLN